MALPKSAVGQACAAVTAMPILEEREEEREQHPEDAEDPQPREHGHAPRRHHPEVPDRERLPPRQASIDLLGAADGARQFHDSPQFPHRQRSPINAKRARTRISRNASCVRPIATPTPATMTAIAISWMPRVRRVAPGV